MTGLKADVVYAARRAVEAQHNLVFTEKFACLPRFLHDIVAKNPGSWMDVKRNEHTSEFMAAFFAFGPAVELLKKVGRNVSGADFGHSTSPVFQGTYALGIHQTGSGAILPVWAACFGGEWRNENGQSWQYCGECVLKAGLQPLYPLGHTNFTDRHKGAHYFGSAIPGIISLNCTKHIIENARNYVQTAQKSFHDNMVWELQGSKSAGEYYVHLAKFNTNFPDVKVNVWFIVPPVLHITSFLVCYPERLIWSRFLRSSGCIMPKLLQGHIHTAGVLQTWQKSVWPLPKK